MAAALQPPVGGPSSSATTRSTFAQILASPIIRDSQTVSNPSDLAPTGTHKGDPAIFFSPPQVHTLAKPFHWTLVGKFSHGYNRTDPKKGRPSLKDLHQYFVTLDLKGSFSLGLLDNRHLLIHLALEEDYLRIYSRMIWYLAPVTMRIFKWDTKFHVEKETSIVPLWITLPRLPIHFFARSALFQIASLIGTPLRMDAATETLKRPSTARLQIEVDLLKSRPSRVWIGVGEQEGFWQRIEYENVPNYCTHCWHVGHSESQCRIQNPELGVLVHDRQKSVSGPKPKQKFVAKPRQPVGDATTVQQSMPSSDNACLAPAAEPATDSIPNPVVSAEGKQSVTSPISPLDAAGLSGVNSAPLLQVPVDEIVPLPLAASQLMQAQSKPLDMVDSALDAPALEVAHEMSQNEPAVGQHSGPPLQVAPLMAQEIGFQAQPVAFVGDHSDNGKLAVRTDVQSIAVEESAPTVCENDPALSVLQICSASQTEPVAPPLTSSGIIVDPPADRLYALSLIPQVTMDTTLNPYAAAFYSPTPSEAYNFQQRTTSSTFQPLVHRTMGYNNTPSYNDSNESDEIDDATDDDSYDITDGSEGTVCQKRKDRKKSKAQTSFQSVTREDFEEQSQILNQRLKKRGRPPGSRNRTYFDVVRTMSTRNTKSTSN